MMSVSTNVRWAMHNGMWAMGQNTPADVPRAFKDYTLAGIADRIRTPALVLDAENDQFLKGEPRRAAQALVNADTTLVTLTSAEGAGEHCHMGAMYRVHQVIFDWFAHTLPKG
jgi:dienelactone hydrolase